MKTLGHLVQITHVTPQGAPHYQVFDENGNNAGGTATGQY